MTRTELKKYLWTIYERSRDEFKRYEISGNPQHKQIANEQRAIASLSYDILEALDGYKDFLNRRIQ